MTSKLLAINFGGIGDEILFLPVLSSIKEAYPDKHVTLLLEPRSKAIKDICNLIDEIKLFDIKKRPLAPNDYLELVRILQGGNYDTVISSGSTPLVACLLFASGIKERIGYDSGRLSRFLLTHAVELNRNQYASDMYHDLVQGLGLKQKQVIPQIQVSEDSLSNMQNFLSSFAKSSELNGKIERVVIHPGTSQLAIKKGIIKTWPAANWVFLINKLLSTNDTQVILAGGPDDEESVAEIKLQLEQDPSFSSKKSLFISAYGKTKSLADLAALIFKSDLLICVDSAPMHIGVGLNKPVLALFGPTNPSHTLPIAPHFKYLHGGINSMSSNLHEIQTDLIVDVKPDAVYQSALDLLHRLKVR